MSSVRCLCLVLAMCLNGSLALESFMAEDGYVVFPTVPGSRYKLYSLKHTWGEALSLCQGDGGGSHLVIINSQQEADVVTELFSGILDTEIYWLFVGINDIVQEGTWVTIEGGLVATSGYNSWTSGEPDLPETQHCGMAHRDGLYGSHWCTDNLPFVCEKPNT